jgi:hypothetical protein
MVEIEIGVLRSQCLDRRIEDRHTLEAEIAAWERQRNATRARIKWMFTTQRARINYCEPIQTQTKSHNHCAEVLDGAAVLRSRDCAARGRRSLASLEYRRPRRTQLWTRLR